MNPGDNTSLTIAVFIGIAKVLTAISILCVLVSLIICFQRGFISWQKSFLIISLVGVPVFWLMSQILQVILRNSEK